MSTSISPFRTAWCLALSLSLVVLAACSSRAPRPVPEARAVDGGLRLLGAAAYPAGTLTLGDGPRFGGVSGLARDPLSGQWVGAIDENEPQRLAWMDVAFGATLTVTPLRFTVLHAGPGASAETMAGLELESLVAMPGGGFAATTEGYHDATDIVHQAEVVFVERDGAFIPTQVTLGDSNREYTAIAEGLREGDQIALNDLGLPLTTAAPARGQAQ